MESRFDEIVKNHLKLRNIHEFALFCMSRQGGRTAVEILARAFIMDGKYAYVGQDLTGMRSLGTNSLVFRYSEKDNVPPGISVIKPEGVMLMNEWLIAPNPSAGGLMGSTINRFEVLSNYNEGLLMVCTAKEPEVVAYPVDFRGTVATVDADRIFMEKVGIMPPTAGITALGLFAKATGLIKVETIIRALTEHERLGKRVRELNAACVQTAYEKTKIARDVKLAATKVPREENEIMEAIANLWQDDLPVCDTKKCVCIECLAAYYCPEAAIRWEDEAINIDYSRCKSCGTCVMECPEKAMRMENGKIVKGKV
ncbi:MAG: hypothetical protein EG826_15875 [Deltaproteobacteria bacterium]|nr:hypothetical protein [Deltaproteobacteria bacterium]